jgi:hypothetical protein
MVEGRTPIAFVTKTSVDETLAEGLSGPTLSPWWEQGVG